MYGHKINFMYGLLHETNCRYTRYAYSRCIFSTTCSYLALTCSLVNRSCCLNCRICCRRAAMAASFCCSWWFLSASCSSLVESCFWRVSSCSLVAVIRFCSPSICCRCCWISCSFSCSCSLCMCTNHMKYAIKQHAQTMHT